MKSVLFFALRFRLGDEYDLVIGQRCHFYAVFKGSFKRIYNTLSHNSFKTSLARYRLFQI
jgi:hypothetical protein